MNAVVRICHDIFIVAGLFFSVLIHSVVLLFLFLMWWVFSVVLNSAYLASCGACVKLAIVLLANKKLGKKIDKRTVERNVCGGIWFLWANIDLRQFQTQKVVSDVCFLLSMINLCQKYMFEKIVAITFFNVFSIQRFCWICFWLI